MTKEKPVRILLDLLPSDLALLDDIKDRCQLRSRGSTVTMLLQSAKVIQPPKAIIKLQAPEEEKVPA